MGFLACFCFARKRFGGLLEPIAAAVELEQMAVMHEPVEDRGAHRVVAEVGPPVLYDAVGGDDDTAMQLVALVDQRLQQGAGVIGNRARQEQVIQHEQIAVEDSSQPGFLLGGWAQGITVKEVVGLEVLYLVPLQDSLVGDSLRQVISYRLSTHVRGFGAGLYAGSGIGWLRRDWRTSSGTLNCAATIRLPSWTEIELPS